MLFGIFVGATCFSFVFRTLGGEHLIVEFIQQTGVGPWSVLLVLMAMIFALGFFFDWIEITLIVMPVFAPIVGVLDFGTHVGVWEGVARANVIWFLVLAAVNLQTLFLTPPFGFALFYMKGVAPPEVRISRSTAASCPSWRCSFWGLPCASPSRRWSCGCRATCWADREGLRGGRGPWSRERYRTLSGSTRMSDPGPETAAPAAAETSPFPVHPLRDIVVGEVHARPFRPVETPRVLHHLAFLTGEDEADEAETALARFCAAQGGQSPLPGVRHHVVTLGNAELRWERHTEFVTMTLVVAPPPGDPFTAPKLTSLAAFLPKPVGELLVASRLALVEVTQGGPDISAFDWTSVCVAKVDDGNAVVATDFRPDASGFTRILVEDRGLGPARAGALVQRLLEIETYRTLALLGLPEAQRVTPIVRRIEREVTALTAGMREASGYESSRGLLDRLTGLAAEIESEAAAVAYRFGATHAYEEIMSLRLADDPRGAGRRLRHDHQLPGAADEARDPDLLRHRGAAGGAVDQGGAGLQPPQDARRHRAGEPEPRPA